MTKLTRAIYRPMSAAVAVVGVGLLLAACGSSSSSSTTAAAPANPAPASATPASNTSNASLTIGTTSGAAGTYLTGAGGRAIYLWVADTGGKSVCSGACAKVWPPVIANGKPSVTGGASASDLGTTARSDGTMQVTYKGHPLYYYITDKSAKMTSGQGSDSFGAKWWLVGPSGASITKTASAGSGSSSSSSSSSSSGSSSGGGSSWS
jgi:predicted lipoprotein with Yx(FWY)xxD motif